MNITIEDFLTDLYGKLASEHTNMNEAEHIIADAAVIAGQLCGVIDARIKELLEANNRYLERARAAEQTLPVLEKLFIEKDTAEVPAASVDLLRIPSAGLILTITLTDGRKLVVRRPA